MMRLIDHYPACTRYGLPVVATHPTHIPWHALEALPADLRDYLSRGLDRQTTTMTGPYPWDVEKLLQRIKQ